MVFVTLEDEVPLNYDSPHTDLDGIINVDDGSWKCMDIPGVDAAMRIVIAEMLNDGRTLGIFYYIVPLGVSDKSFTPELIAKKVGLLRVDFVAWSEEYGARVGREIRAYFPKPTPKMRRELEEMLARTPENAGAALRQML